MNLAEIQSALFALTSGEVEPSPEAVGFIADSAVDSRRRVEAYADAIRGKAAHAVGVPYRKIATLLGEPRFLQLFDAHKRSRPPERRTLRDLVWELPEFLGRNPAWGRADLGALAALELARHEVSVEVGIDPVGADALATLAPRRWPAATLRLVPSLRLIRVSFDVSGLWRAVDERRPPPPPVEAATTLLVWRKGLDVYHSVLSAAEAAALDRAAAGAPLSEVLAPFGHEADQAHAALHGWFADGLVGSVVT
jgi:hypothetical protein